MNGDATPFSFFSRNLLYLKFKYQRKTKAISTNSKYDKSFLF